jgi:hypothetical protein
MRTPGRRQGAQSERGIVLVLAALAMVAILVIAALVIDMGATRAYRRDARAAADAGASAGALVLTDDSGLAACLSAFEYTVQNLGLAQPSGGFSATCAALAGACGTTARSASYSSGTTAIRVTSPVLDGSSLMRGDLVGGGAAQTAVTDIDGEPCDRLAVEVTQAQASFFRGVVGGGAADFSVHSVARFNPTPGQGSAAPALVALNATACRAIDAGNNGDIIIEATSEGPGIAYADSTGPSCTSSTPIIDAYSSGRLVAEASGSSPGTIAWVQAPTTRALHGGSTQQVVGTSATNGANYVGSMFARSEPITRTPVDERYRCTNITPATDQPDGCTATSDLNVVQSHLDLAGGSGVPSGFTTYAGPCSTASGVAQVTIPAGGLYVNCPTFEVKGGAVNFLGGGTVVFAGGITVDAGGTLLVNTTPLGSSSPTLAGGYPSPANAGASTALVLRSTAASAFRFQSASAAAYLAQTAIVSRGGFDLGGGPVLRWSAPATGALAGLMYWSESAQPVSLSGSPTIRARGIFFHGNGAIQASGSGTIDLTNVQVWANTFRISTGGPQLLLAPDSEFSIKTEGAGTSLVR